MPLDPASRMPEGASRSRMRRNVGTGRPPSPSRVSKERWTGRAKKVDSKATSRIQAVPESPVRVPATPVRGRNRAVGAKPPQPQPLRLRRVVRAMAPGIDRPETPLPARHHRQLPRPMQENLSADHQAQPRPKEPGRQTIRVVTPGAPDPPRPPCPSRCRVRVSLPGLTTPRG